MSYKLKSLIYLVCFLITATAYYILEHGSVQEQNAIEIAEADYQMTESNTSKIEQANAFDGLE
ncbi:hypothetical protein [Spongiimicrobium salis]|uniref:hypothetical protein n=1 Tax=Spongiimicrobium salis TaxID=1667022 RepID=UPI00374D1C00